jgi:hypothetical protein
VARSQGAQGMVRLVCAKAGRGAPLNSVVSAQRKAVDLWDIFQQGQIEAARAAAGSARDTALNAQEKVQREIHRLESKIDGLALISQALWELIRQHTSLTDADIRAKVAEIDARDGRIDGRITGTPGSCAKCNRPTHSRQVSCMYCGEPIDKGHVFER